MEGFQSATNVYNEYKTRNILSLADRIQVIREYDSCPTRPSFQSLATRFDCSSKQIKNILLSRESILKAYKEAGEGALVESRDEILQKRLEKIEFLGKVMYEYIQRVVYFNYAVDEEKVRQKALQIKECIAIENFQANNGWFSHFKLAYGIPGFDMESLHNNVQLTEAKRPHLSAIDMIQYVSRQEQKAQKADANSLKRKRGRPSRLERIQRQGQNMLQPSIEYETLDDAHEDADDDDDDDDEVHSDSNGIIDFGRSNTQATQKKKKPTHTTFHDQILQEFGKTKSSTPPPLRMTLEKSIKQSPQKRKRSNSPFPDIDTPHEALRHVKVLEEYAMLQDNYRAIGLLTQLEEIFKKKSKDT